MRHTRSTLLLLAVTPVVAACGPEAVGHPAAPALQSRVTGIWDATFELDRVPIGRLPDAPADARAVGAHATARGVLALAPNAHAAADAQLPARTTHTGVYDVEFRALGFTPYAAGPVATLLATVIAPDSIVGVLPAGEADGAVVWRGVVTGDSVAGTWSYGTRAVGGWGGRFVFHRRSPAGR